ncbi:hypothetical protein PAXINDRAFT_88850 [Paxillus involutus ATCC 200175]|uniref:WD40 repeat-like protein n=1 Tax=Paxillus involutus ATCC 200175 TaxID=664439 RepID=A0A0C9TM89_PAXIN|nr:hypothetical protein PAXINDRAFT_88850 [Paxillus involutus ATCC 200175]
MHSSSRSVSLGIANTLSSASSRLVSLEGASHRVPVRVLEGHEADVNCVCFYPDENKLVSGSDDGTLRIWDRETGAVEVLSGHTRAVLDVDVSRDGQMVVSGSADKTVQIWNRESGELHIFEGHERWVRGVEFSLDSSRVVCGSEDGTVQVWSETGELAFEPIKCHGYVCGVRYSPSGDRIATVARNVQIWDAETGSGILTILNSEVTSLVWTTDGTYQLAAFKHGQNSNGIAYSPSGKFIATACEDAKVYVWEAPSFEDRQTNVSFILVVFTWHYSF